MAAAEGAVIPWNQQTLVAGASQTAGVLSLKPADTDWNATTAVSRNGVAFWTHAGTQFRLHLEPDIQKEGSNLDGIVTVALLTTPVLQRMQAADDIVGLTIAFKKSQSQAYIGLVRKEKSGPETMRGSQWGDPQGFAGDQKLTAPSKALDLTVTVTDTAITVAAAGVGEISSPHGLTKATWAQAYPAVQAQNFGPGRFSVAVINASIK